jgi:hypothetical protein
MAITRLVTLRIRLRTFFFRPPVFCSICFIVRVRVSTRVPSCKRLLSVG